MKYIMRVNGRRTSACTNLLERGGARAEVLEGNEHLLPPLDDNRQIENDFSYRNTLQTYSKLLDLCGMHTNHT